MVFLAFNVVFKKDKKLLTAALAVLLALSGLPLLLAQSAAQSNYLFSDSFANADFSAWTGTKSYRSGVSASLQSAIALDDSYAMKVTVADGSGESGVCIYKDLTTKYTAINARVYMRLNGNPSSDAKLEVFGFSSDGWIPNTVGAQVNIHGNGGAAQWQVDYYRNGWQTAIFGTVTPDKWYCVELKLVIGRGTGETRLYVDGTEVFTQTGLTNTAPGSSVRYFCLGVDDEFGGNNLNVFYDAVALSKSYIGPLSVLPTPSPSPSPSPTPTASPSPTSTPTVTPTATPTNTPTPTPTSSPTPSPSPSPTPTATPTITPTPTPSPTPTSTLTPTYKEINLNRPIQASWIAADGTLYAGSGNTLYKSPDGGVTWQSLLSFSGSSTTLDCVYVSSQGYIFASPSADSLTSSAGFYRSVNGGQTWTKVMALSIGCSIWPMAQDNDGNLFAGIYTSGWRANASIFKSVDGGAHWTTVFYDPDARHIHGLDVDLSNNYVYATVGDVRVTPEWTCYVIRSVNDGAPNSWNEILTLPQMLSVEAVNKVDANGNPVAVARIFSTDYDNGQIWRTTDDSHFNLVFDMGDQAYGFWIRSNSLNGEIYASFLCGEGPRQWISGIYASSDYGASWSLYKSFSSRSPYDGSPAASNFQDGTLYYAVQVNGVWQNGVKIYPSYPSTNQNTGALSVLAPTAEMAILISVIFGSSLILHLAKKKTVTRSRVWV